MISRATRILMLGVALLGMPAYGTPPTDPMEVARQLLAAGNKASGGDCAGAMVEIGPLLKSPGFAALPDQGKQAGYGMAAACETLLGKENVAYGHALAATRVEGPDPTVWRTRLGLELQKKDAAAALVTIEAMLPRHQDALNAIPISWLFRLNRTLRDKPDPAAQRRLLAILSSPAYVPDEIATSGDGFRRDYAVMLIAAGDKSGAVQQIQQIGDPFDLLEMSLDPRLSAMIPPDFDARAAFESRLARFRDLAASHPGSLSIIVQASRFLRVLGRPSEALAMLEAAKPAASQGNDFADIDEMRNWWWNEMAYNYAMLGRYDEAVAAFRGGIAAKEGGRVNVSQTINLSHVQLRFGRARDALATLAPLDGDQGKTSEYGAMALRDGRGCARFLAGDVVGAKADLDYAIAHERDASAVVTNLQLCMNDLNGAAASLIRRLDNPTERADALKQLSDYDPPLATLPPDPLDKALAAVKARPDVAAAITRAGGIRRFKLQSYAL